jgi:hypothetical protein
MSDQIEVKHNTSFDPINYYYPPSYGTYHASHDCGGYKMTKMDIRRERRDMFVDILVHLLLGVLYVIVAICYAVSISLWIQLLANG